MISQALRAIAAGTRQVRCAVCDADDAVPVVRFEELELRTRSRIDWWIVRCRCCGMVYENPRPNHDARDTYGGDDYGFVRSVPADALVDGRRHQVRVLAEVESHVGIGALLDVGCSTGELLAEARSHGWRVHGVDVSAHAARLAARRGLQVSVGTLPEAGLPAGSFDAVTLLDVIEHLEDPAAELMEMHRLLRPGGLLCVETPNWNSVYRLLLGRRWASLQPRVHILYFDAVTLGRLLRRCGFEVVEVRTEIASLFSSEAMTRGLGPGVVRSVLREKVIRLLFRAGPWLDGLFLRLGGATGPRRDSSFRWMAAQTGSGAEPAPVRVDGPGWRLLRWLNGPLDRALIARGRGDQLRIHARRM